MSEPEEGRVVSGWRDDQRCAMTFTGEEQCVTLLQTAHEANLGVYMHRDRTTGKLVLLCGEHSAWARFYASLRLPLVAL